MGTVRGCGGGHGVWGGYRVWGWVMGTGQWGMVPASGGCAGQWWMYRPVGGTASVGVGTASVCWYRQWWYRPVGVGTCLAGFERPSLAIMADTWLRFRRTGNGCRSEV